MRSCAARAERSTNVSTLAKPSFRPYEPDQDFDSMFAITREIVGMPPFEEARRELLAYPSKSTTALVAVGAEGDAVGFCAASHPYWNAVAILDYLVVARPCRNQGIGARLVRATEQSLLSAEMRRVCVQTISWNEDAIRFYERLGFRTLARLPAYFNDEHDLVWLDRALGADPSTSA
jgi:ribosomal protein S18 acetylase RimI-like enzyme